MRANRARRQRRTVAASLRLPACALALGVAGCALPSQRHDHPRPRPAEPAPHATSDPEVRPATVTLLDPVAMPEPVPGDLAGPQPLDAYIRRALAENRTVQAAFHNVMALRHRVPQVTTLDDPVASNTVFPVPSVAPQYSLMGYNPYNLTLAQQFPWFGTLRLRGEVAEGDAQVAVAELAAAQLDAVAAVKRSYFDLDAALKTEAILAENRRLLDDFRQIASNRLEAGGSQQDVLRSEILISELDRESAANEQEVAAARAALARQIHVAPDADLRTQGDLTLPPAPAELARLYRLAIAARPELKGRLAAVIRDEKAVALARKRFYPNVTLGLTYMDMERTNAEAPATAGGMPNIGLFVGFNLPIYRAKYRAGVCEAQQRAIADAKLYEAQRDEAFSEIRDLLVQVRVQQETLRLLQIEILPRTRQMLALAKTEYAQGTVDYATVISALREILQVRLQIVQAEAEQGKALAALERAVGGQLNESPPTPEARRALAAEAAPTPPPADGPGPFRPEDDQAREEPGDGS